MFNEILWLIFLTLLPGLELRLSIPVGLLQEKFFLPFGLAFQGFGLPLPLVFFVCVFTNAVLGAIIFFVLNNFVEFFLRFQTINSIYSRLVLRTQKKIAPLVEKYGSIGIALFIAVPLPGSGSYTGALAAYLLGLSYRRFILVNAIGVFIAGVLVTLFSLGVLNFFGV